MKRLIQVSSKEEILKELLAEVPRRLIDFRLRLGSVDRTGILGDDNLVGVGAALTKDDDHVSQEKLECLKRKTGCQHVIHLETKT